MNTARAFTARTIPPTAEAGPNPHHPALPRGRKRRTSERKRKPRPLRRCALFHEPVLHQVRRGIEHGLLRRTRIPP